nr:MAG TPA: Minor capsid protein [Caudoviricetes sp.]
MMVAKLRGINEARQKTLDIIDDVISLKAVRAVKSANYIIRTEAAVYTPIDTSNLINSQFDVVEINGTRITGKVGYTARYAYYVHEASGKLMGKPRRSGKGNYWDPEGEPKFLELAANRTKELVYRTIRREMKL